MLTIGWIFFKQYELQSFVCSQKK